MTVSHPERIGPYQITRVLGQGGMGLVYEAEQLEPLRRTVALKVIRRGMDTEEVLARFESERQALAVMDHPNIARALEAGTTEEGLPYFVMELVNGVPLTDYCDDHELDVRHRLELFTSVCKGVQHAHQKGVIHRDLKPSNILVRVIDGKPVPTIIDFGIAKAVENRLTKDGYVTELGELVGTPFYMSPEQAEASGLDIDTRADIYSLGMVLYELVAGVLPFESANVMAVSYIMKYVLADAEVPTPSRRIATLAGDTGDAVARHRHTTPHALRRQLQGDLDWIALKAIARDRTRRYETANAFGNDIERYLQNKPIAARPPTVAYTTAKFVRRHRLAVSVAATALVALVVLVTSITRERNRAQLAGAKAQAISGFLQDMLTSADPWQGGARQITVAEALKAGVAKVNGGSIQDPLVAASIKRTIGTVYLNMGRIGDADTLLRAVLAERRTRTGPSSEATAESYSDLGLLYELLGKYDSAAAALKQSLTIRVRRLGTNDTLVAQTLLDLATMAKYLGQHERSDSLSGEALRILRNAYGDRDPRVAAAMGKIVTNKVSQDDYAAVDSLAPMAIGILREHGRAKSPEITGLLNDLALSKAYQGEYPEARKLMGEVVSIDSALFGTSYPDLAAHLENLGLVYSIGGFEDSNVMVLNQALAMRRAVLAPDNPDIGRSLFNLAVVEYSRGAYAKALPLYEQALPLMEHAYGPEHSDVVWATASLGRNLYRLGRRPEAERYLRRALQVTDPDGKLTGNDFARMGSVMVSLLVDEHRWSEAEPLAREILAVRDSLKDSLAVESARQLVVIYEGLGKPSEVAKYRERVAVNRGN